MMKGGMAGLMKQAQQMQEKMEQFLGKEDADAILRIGSRLQDLKD